MITTKRRIKILIKRRPTASSVNSLELNGVNTSSSISRQSCVFWLYHFLVSRRHSPVSLEVKIGPTLVTIELG